MTADAKLAAHLIAVVGDLPHSVSAFDAVRDESGRIVDFTWTYANAASAAITGYSNTDLVGHSLLEVLPDHGPSGMLDVYAAVVDTGEPHVNPTLWYEDAWGDGQRVRRCFDIRATKVGDGFVVVTREVTDAMRAVELQAEALEHEQQMNERLRELDAAKSALMAAVAHDFRTPLTAMVGYGWILDNAWEELSEEERREMLLQVIASGNELERRITTVLDRVRIDTGTLTIELEACALQTEVDGALQRMETLLQSHTIERAIPDGLAVEADAIALARVLENLISNAVKYSPRGSVVTIAAEVDGDEVIVSVLDEGEGIDPEEAKAVFEPFYRTERGRAAASGSGVGLASARSMLELMRGRIWCAAREPRGTAFRFALPLSR